MVNIWELLLQRCSAGRSARGSPGGIFLILGGLVSLGSAGRGRAGDHLDYRYERYGEEQGRMQIDTSSLLFEQRLIDAVTAKGELVYDGISGATPNGLPPPPGSKQVPLAQMTDIRRAGNLEFDLKWGPQTLAPQVAYSKESDYESIGVSLNDAIEFNQKNTTLRFGVAHNFDQVHPTHALAYFSRARSKDATDLLVGVSQLLSPKTVFTADFTYGMDDGYLADPYRGVEFTGYPVPAPFPEQRPSHRTREVAMLSLTQFIEPLKGSAEVSYRFYHDSFGIHSHTAAVGWHQKIGRHVVLSPFARYYVQTAATFYGVSFPGDPTLSLVGIPKYYSADYRLSHFESFTYGLQASLIIEDHVYLDAGYQRYEMRGLDGVTSASAYPQANIFTLGVRLWF